jgi:DNA mismatch repair protein MutS2
MQSTQRATEQALELGAALAVVGSFCSSDLGRDLLTSRPPATAMAELARRRTLFEETERLLAEAPLVPSQGEAMAPVLQALFSPHGEVGGRELLRLAGLLRVVEQARARVESEPGPFPAWRDAFSSIPETVPLARRIESAIDRRGNVREDASPQLVALRSGIRRLRDQLYRDLTAHASRHRESLAEDTIPLRNNRLVLLLEAGERGKVPGLLHGRSASGKSFYFEPLETVESNNQLQQSLEDEALEKQRVVREILAEVLRQREAVAGAAAAFAELDAQQGAARFAQACGARLAEAGAPRPSDGPAASLRLIGARHPLLDPRLGEARQAALGDRGHQAEIVPLDLDLGSQGRVLLLTGPNAGGKTVALKTVGLLALLHHHGLPVPCERGSRLPWIESCVATVGDEQDLLADRSTFSGRLLRLREAWEAASPASLVLLDELGSGTDPDEGAALAIALLEHLLRRGGFAVVTTHLTRLAAAALELPGAVCGAMEFSPASGRPTFRLVLGPPGGSEAIALARRLGLSAEWTERADALLGPEQRNLRRLLAEIERARDELGLARERLDTETSDLAKIRQRLDRERAALEVERKTVGGKLRAALEQFRQETQRKLAGEIEHLREEFASGKRKALAERASERLFAQAPDFAADESISAPLAVGQAVRHRGLGWSGALEKIEGPDSVVRVRGKRVRCGSDELIAVTDPLAQRPPSTGKRPPMAEPAVEDTPIELNLIGMRVEAALETLDRFLDQSARARRTTVRVVHGHGTGRLRDALRLELRRHPLVASQRPGEPREGGNGATVVELRQD